MLKHRIIPVLLLKNGRMIKTVQFGRFRDVGDPVTTARVYNDMRADELFLLDIEASIEGRQTFMDIVAKVAEECFMPLGVGGGIRTMEDIRRTIQGGADKVVINTAAAEHPEFITEGAERFGASTIMVSIDARQHPDGAYEVYTHRGTRTTGLDPVQWAKEAAARGAGEIMITSIDREGTMQGLDFELIKRVIDAVTVPVIAHGGVGVLSDFKRAYDLGASAVAAGSIFHFTDQSPIMVRNYLVHQGVSVRP